MNTIIRLSLCAALTAPFAQFAIADSPPAAKTGRVLLIDYDRILEGDIERSGDRFRIRQGAGEMTIPATPAMLLLPNKDAAFHLLKSRAKLSDPVALVKLSRWCLSNELQQQALEMAEMALALLPNDRSLQRFRDDVKLRVTLAPPAPVKPAAALPAKPQTEPAIADVSPESYGLFATRVQPLLINACANCHASGRGGNFHLNRPSAAFGDQRTTQMNLAAAGAYLNREQPQASPLLSHAVAAHGGGSHPPIRDRQSLAFKYLEEWTRQACGNPIVPGKLPAEAVADASPLPAAPARPTITGKPAAPPPVLLSGSASEPIGPVTQAKAVEPAAKEKIADSPPQSPKKEPVDPFDPELFNRMNEKPIKSP
jgi:hypothetical protein